MKKWTIIRVIIISTLFISCSGNSDSSLDDLYGNQGESTAYIYIDNGADTTVNVTISASEGEEVWEYVIEGFKGESTDIPHGKYHITAVTVTDSIVVDEDFELSDDEYEYNLNLTKEDYIVENITYYLNLEDADQENSSFTYDDATYQGTDALALKGNLVMSKVWDYNLHEELPEEVELSNGQSQTMKRKLWKASTFILLLQIEMLLNDYGDEYEWEEQ
jgi:hypothetical protein